MLRGRYEEAIAEFEREMASSGARASVNLAGTAHAYALAGRRDEALKFLEEAKTLILPSPYKMDQSRVVVIR